MLFGPVHVSVGKSSASWSGQCTDLWWNCKVISGHIMKDTKEVFVDTSEDTKLDFSPRKPIGKIIDNNFVYHQTNPLEKYISYTPWKVDKEKLIVSYSVTLHPFNKTSEVNFRFNKFCTEEQALLGALVVAEADHLKSSNLKGP